MKLKGVLLSAFVLVLSGCGSGVPEEIDGWQVEVGPPGNEFYQAPPPVEEAPPPPEELLEKVRAIAPDYTEIRRWELQREDRYFIRAEREPEEYDFLFTRDGRLLRLDYEDDLQNIVEQPGRIVLSGTKSTLALSQLPAETRRTLDKVLPANEVSEAYRIESLHGPRFVAVIQDTAFFALPDGQIRAAGPAEAALHEVRREDVTPRSDEEILGEAAAQLGPYQDRFNVDNQKGHLAPKAEDFRFVVVGDSRSNPELWRAIAKHINLLEPKPRFVINTGDIVLRGYTREYFEYFLPPLEEFDLPFFVAIGNHDDGDDGKALEYRYLFGENSLNYFFDYGSWRFIVIDNSSSVFTADETLSWLQKVLDETPEGRNLIVAAHKPIANVEKWAYHSWDPENSNRFADLMSEHDVRHVFFGHIHAYSTATYKGIPYTITGGGGAGLHDRYGPEGNVHNYVICDVSGDTLTQQVVRFRRPEEESAPE